MWKKIFVSIFVIFIVQNVDSAMRKSWKSPANFESKVPKFTPFEDVVNNEVTEPPVIQTTKINAKIKYPEQHAADIFNQIKESNKIAQDFGSFVYQVPETSSEEEELDNEIPNKLLNNNFSNENEDEDEIEFDVINNDGGMEYKVGQLMNITVDSKDETVNVNLNEQSLKEIFTGNKRGRGRKHTILERMIPLFILPFLIQAAIVPFMVASIKLFLMKSLFSGKVAILFFILGALKSHQNSLYMKSAQNPPVFLKDYPSPYLPERRIETGFDGYKVDGKPEAFIN